MWGIVYHYIRERNFGQKLFQKYNNIYARTIYLKFLSRTLLSQLDLFVQPYKYFPLLQINTLLTLY